MVISDEPGLYLEGEYNTRSSVCFAGKRKKTSFGRFLAWEVLTLVPFDREAILPEIMEKRDVRLLNDYHSTVRRKMLPLMKTKAEKDWLLEATEPL